MTASSPSAFFLSASLHALVVALLLLFSFAAGRVSKDEPKVFELVAGEGDNYGATVAPALGTPEGMKLTVPAAPVAELPKPEPAKPEPARPEPVKTEPTPALPTPKPKQPTKETPPKDFAKQLQTDIRNAKRKAERQVAKERAAEEKRQAEEKKKMSKAEFDAKHKVASATPTKSSATKIQKIDAEGISKGVVGGSTENKIGGQGGKALKTDNTNVMDAFYAMFRERVRKNFEPPPGLADTVNVEISVVSHPDGSFSGAKVTKTSGSKEFDDAVLSAVRRVRMAPRPDKKTDTITFIFAMSDREER